MKVKSLSHVWLFVTPWTVAYQTPLSMGFSRQEYWSGLPFSSPGDLPQAGIKPPSPALEGGFLTTEPPRKSLSLLFFVKLEEWALPLLTKNHWNIIFWTRTNARALVSLWRDCGSDGWEKVRGKLVQGCQQLEASLGKCLPSRAEPSDAVSGCKPSTMEECYLC